MPYVRSSICQTSSFTSYRGSAVSTDTIDACRGTYNRERKKAVVTEEECVRKKDNIKEWTGQSLSLLLRIADDRS